MGDVFGSDDAVRVCVDLGLAYVSVKLGKGWSTAFVQDLVAARIVVEYHPPGRAAIPALGEIDLVNVEVCSCKREEDGEERHCEIGLHACGGSGIEGRIVVSK